MNRWGRSESSEIPHSTFLCNSLKDAHIFQCFTRHDICSYIILHIAIHIIYGFDAILRKFAVDMAKSPRNVYTIYV